MEHRHHLFAQLVQTAQPDGKDEHLRSDEQHVVLALTLEKDG